MTQRAMTIPRLSRALHVEPALGEREHERVGTLTGRVADDATPSALTAPRDEPPHRVERDRLDPDQGRRGPPNSGSSQNWISAPCAWRGWMKAVRWPPGISALPTSSRPSASRRRTSGSSRSTSIAKW